MSTSWTIVSQKHKGMFRWCLQSSCRNLLRTFFQIPYSISAKDYLWHRVGYNKSLWATKPSNNGKWTESTWSTVYVNLLLHSRGADNDRPPLEKGRPPTTLNFSLAKSNLLYPTCALPSLVSTQHKDSTVTKYLIAQANMITTLHTHSIFFVP
jgi:hypothetical protein